jgi:hypothetical protein
MNNKMLLSFFRRHLPAIAILLTCLTGMQADDTRFLGITPGQGSAVRLEGIGPNNAVYHLEGSTNLFHWQEFATLIPDAGWFQFLDVGAVGQPQRYYRFSTRDLDATNDWKNQVSFPYDPFAAGGSGTGDQVRWIKFLILPEEPTRVYFQDCQLYVLHYDFARTRFSAFKSMSREAFDQVTLHTNQQQAILGTVLFPPTDNLPEFAIQFTGQDAFPGDFIAKFFAIVRAAVAAPPGTEAYYFPAYEQSESALSDEAFFASQGIQLGSPYRWINGDQVYASGWAFGRLRYLPANEINAAYADGRLKPEDILLTDGVPAELPFVSGILSLVPATPNSHVALLAAAYQVPFGYVAEAVTQQRYRQLADREIILQCSTRGGYDQITVLDVEGKLDETARLELRQLKLPPKANITPKAPYGALSASTDALQPSDRRYFGGKAANYGILRRMIPTNCEPAIAFSFDLWDAFLNQSLPAGGTLRQTIQTKLGSFTNYPPNMATVKTRLAEVRQLITQNTTFTLAQTQAIYLALAPFDTNRNLRFRSSSNAEDSQSFAAAGLYDSYSGCLADDMDNDNVGPSHGDPSEPNERGVFRAIKKVFASFYNDNAFLERLRNGIDESQVGMALLVHYSTPDDIEMANGVGQMSRQESFFGPGQLAVNLVTQEGALSVANPEGNAQPELVSVGEYSPPTLARSSSLMPLGASVLLWDTEYQALFDMMFKVYTNYSALMGYSLETTNPLLDFEYKKVKPGQLIIKQIRELPGHDTSQTDPYLVSQPATYWVFQYEQSDVMANHRLKGLFTLDTANLRLTTSNLARCFYTNAHFEYRIDNDVRLLEGSPSSWSNAVHTVVADARYGHLVRDTWTVGSGTNRRTYALVTAVPQVNSTENVVLTQRDLKKWLEVTYAAPVPTLNGMGAPTTTTNEEVQLVLSPDLAQLKPQPAETFDLGKGVSIAISFLVSNETGEGPLPSVDPNPFGVFPAYYSSWAHAMITGLLPEPIALNGYYSTSARAGHKEMFKWFVLEPALDPDLPAAQRAALEAANIRLIYVYREFLSLQNATMILGFDGVFRPL